MKKNRKWISSLLVFCMLLSQLPVSVLAQTIQDNFRVTETVEIIDLPDIQTTAQSARTPSIEINGIPGIKSTREINWIDRLANLPSYATKFYNWLVENSDGDGQSDALIDPAAGAVLNDGYVCNVVKFEDSEIPFTYRSGASDPEIENAAVDALTKTVSSKQSEIIAYITAVYGAFDRDHPEVFWLSGASECSISCSFSYAVNGNGSGTVVYDMDVDFILQAPDFDVRAEEYRSVGAVRSAITARNSAVAAITRNADGTRYAKVQYLNNWLTKNNCYNTNSDLSGISQDCRNCVGALIGSTGTNGPVCEGYARAFKVLCDELSIPCVLVDGTATNSNGSKAHMWNYVQMEDGNWYAVDVTWNDPSVDGVSAAESKHENENYLLVGSETVIDGRAFINSHPVSNVVSSGGVAFTNGPELAKNRYQNEHNRINDLTEVDYLAFSTIAYKQLGTYGSTVQECLTAKGYWTKTWNKTFGITYADLCESIASWKFTDASNKSSFNGFYAAVFTNDQGEAVIAYRGSVPPTSFDSIMGWDFYCDWLLNDLPLELANSMGPQLDSAIGIYEDVIDNGYEPSKIVLTGHSLGGAWADTVSAYSGSRATTFNAVSIMDVLYKDQPKRMSKNFEGVDRWMFVDHTNKNDILAGMFEHYLSTEMKPYISYNGNITVDASLVGAVAGAVAGLLLAGPGGIVVGGIAGSFGDEIAACHGMESLVMVDAYGKVAMTGETSRFIPNKKITNYMLTKNHSVDLGTSRSDTVSEALTVLVSRTSYGGAGDDNITTSARGDTIIGGSDIYGDNLDGGWGDDTYIYWIGDGYDKIWDISGMDTLKIYGAPSGSSISTKVNNKTDMVDIYCNDQLIVSIYCKNRHYQSNIFTVSCNGVERDISADLITAKFGNSIRIGCPISVEVLDTNSNVVFTLTDGEVGTWYTDYGNFYVFEEENGEYGKVLDLVEGYSARIVGAGEGTMDVTYQVPMDGELTAPVFVTGVPVTEQLIATIVENENGEMVLAADADGDGITDQETVFVANTCNEGHSYEPLVTEPTCTEQGYTTHTCTVCGDSYVDSHTDALGHAYGEWCTAKEPTCTADGEEQRHCDRCDHFETKQIEAAGHDYENGMCIVCGNIGEILEGLQEGDFIFSVTDGIATITEYVGSDVDVTVPGEIGGYAVVAVGRHAFNQNDSIRSISIGEGICYLSSEWAFRCNSLEKISLPSTLIMWSVPCECENVKRVTVADDGESLTVHDGVLYDEAMTELLYYPPAKEGTIFEIPEGIVTIGDSACEDAVHLEEVKMPDSVTYIGYWAFCGCHDLETINISESCEIIGQYAFTGTALRSVFIPAALIGIMQPVFDGTARLEEITVDPNNPVYSVRNGSLYLTEMDCLVKYPIGRTDFYYEIPENTKSIAWGAFESGFGSEFESRILVFTGDAPEIHSENFANANAVAYYPADNDTWTQDILDEYYANFWISWIQECREHDFQPYECAPNCGYQGYIGERCTVCRRPVIDRILPATNEHHYEVYYVSPPTCTEQGYTAYVCDICNDYYKDSYVDALGHSFTDWTMIQNPTEDTEGMEARRCVRCDLEETRVIARLEIPFLDVPIGSFYYEPVKWAVKSGITNGTSATTFSPSDQCMRAHVVTFLWKAAGSPEPARKDNPFVDVKPADFFYKPVLWALENGITSGVDTTHFGPASYCNRAQVITFLYQTKNRPAVESTGNPFTDVPNGQWFTTPVLWAVENGITSGLSSTSFGPGVVCNRAQIVTFLYKAFVND